MKSDKQLLDDPSFGNTKKSDRLPGKFKGKMKWPSGREAPLNPIDVYLNVGDANYWRGIAILDVPFDRIVVSLRKGLPDGIYPAGNADDDVIVTGFYDGMYLKYMEGTVKFDTKMGNLKITEATGSFKVDYTKTPDMPDSLKNEPKENNKEIFTFKLSCNFEFLNIAK